MSSPTPGGGTAWSGRSTVMTGRILIILLLGLITACEISDSSRWPHVQLIATELSRSYVTGNLIPMYAHLDGTVIEAQIVPADSLLEALQETAETDLVVFNNPEQLEQMVAQGLLADSPWRFLRRRDRVAIFWRSDRPETIHSIHDLVPPRIGSLGVMSPDGQVQTFLIRKALWDTGQISLLERKTLYFQRVDELVGQVRTGEIQVGVIHESDLTEAMQAWARWMVVDPSPHQGQYCGAAVLRGTAHPREARRAWNYINEKMQGYIEIH